MYIDFWKCDCIKQILWNYLALSSDFEMRCHIHCTWKYFRVPVKQLGRFHLLVCLTFWMWPFCALWNIQQWKGEQQKFPKIPSARIPQLLFPAVFVPHSVQWMFLVLQIQTNFPGSLWNILAAVCLAAGLCCLGVEGQLLQVRAPHKVLPHLALQRLDSDNWGFLVHVSFQTARDEFHCKHWKGLCSLLQSTAVLLFDFTL